MIYNNIRKITLALIAALCMMSCTDLDVDVESRYTDENFPTTDADMEAVCGPAYSKFRPGYGRWYWLMTTATTDEGTMAVNGPNWYDNGKYGEMSLHTWHPNSEIVTLNWDNLFSCISECNQILSMLEKAPEIDAKPRYIAEVRTMRALYYYWMMDNYGDLPIIDKIGIDTPDRSPRKDVAEFIVKELEESYSALTDVVDGTTYAKPTKYMADALLAKLYLNWAVYSIDDVANYEPSNDNPNLDKAIAHCDNIINSKKYDLSDPWLDRFKDTNGPQIKDFIYAFAYEWTTDRYDWDGITHFRFWGHKFFENTFNLKKKPSGVMRANPEFLDIYNLEGDVRNNIWRGGLQYNEKSGEPFIYEVSKRSHDAYYAGADFEAKIKWHFELTRELVIRGKNDAEKADNLRRLDLGNDELGLAMGYRNVKFYPTAESTVHPQSNDMPIFRYADVLLMKAEAILRGGKSTLGETPISLVNKVRTAAEAPQVTAVTLDEICDERARELADEYWRRNDLIRFGKFENDWGLKKASLGTANTDKYRRVFPVPVTVMQKNIHWEQTKGYK
ncbi:RagB/SusD family nutrient uptake outer membrane protein [Dysgonomonas massiliensis]|uniref:RagB/SusD family nutrient uptake outer membrane protein n=1 Tax=Dysgonomonas massiliensis TaxID=2040292 RepID=UPI000C786FA4|nr:RagB/SusD family nutrient uptake outer membrane protein [Dysgonomonas massiliensis]